MNIVQRFLGSMYGRMRTCYYQNRYAFYKKRYTIKSTFKFQGTDIRIYGDGQISLGDDSYIGSLSTIELAHGCKVSIGKYCMISHNVRIYTSTDIPDQDFRNNQNHKSRKGDVIIGDGVWVGANVFISPGITIGENSVIGANSVVTKDVPSNAIVGGVPAAYIRMKQDM